MPAGLLCKEKKGAFMKDSIKKLWQRSMCFFLAMITVLSLCPTAAFAATTTDTTNTTATEDAKQPEEEQGRTFGYLTFDGQIIDGAGNLVQGKKTGSFFAVVMVNASEQILQKESAAKIRFNASYTNPETGNPNTDYKVKIAYTTDPSRKNHPDSDITTGNGSATGDLIIDQTKAEIVYYVSVIVTHIKTGEVVKRSTISVTSQRLHKRATSIYYSRCGMQVRVIDDIPFGTYDYSASQNKKVQNTKGVVKNPSGTYTGMDGQQYENAYCDIRLENDSVGTSVVTANPDDIKNVISKMVQGVLIKDNVAGFNAAKGYFEAKGPAYVICRGQPVGEKTYSLQYYHNYDTGATSPNSYAGWASNTRVKDWEGNLRYLTMIIPLSLTGTVTVNYYDEDNPTQKIKDSTVLTTKEFQKAISEKNAMNTFIMETSSAFTQEYVDLMGGWKVVINNDNAISDFASYRHAISATPSYNKETKKWSMISTDATAKISEIMGIRNSTLASIMTNKLTAPYVQTAQVTVPDIPGYEFDFGYGSDAMTAMTYGSLLFSVDSKTATAMMTADSPAATVNLYYKGIGDTSYTVKVRKNGEIDESYTKKYDASVGDRIEKEDVDTSYIPKDWTINDIENVPLDVVKDPTKNIIIIDCTAPVYLYTVMYYLDGVFKEKAIFEAVKDEIIAGAPLKNYSGYHIDKVTGTPLTIVDNNGVIRVYYVKDAAAPNASLNTQLFKDEYRTKITKSKSGYGVYGLFYVDVSRYVDARSYPSWTYKKGCGTGTGSKVVKTYKDINVTATATWSEGLPIDPNNEKGNRKGHSVTVNLVKDNTRSTERVWVFHFPQNSQSATKYPKAYIPIGWANNTNWTVSFQAKMTAQEYHYDNYYVGVTCSHILQPSHTVDTYPLKEWYEDYSRTFTGSGSIMVNGSMYEDDFTGGRN